MKKVILGAALALTTLAGVATAGLSFETEWTYYDANGEIVGGRLLACSGKGYNWGVQTSNYTISRESCLRDEF